MPFAHRIILSPWTTGAQRMPKSAEALLRALQADARPKGVAREADLSQVVRPTTQQLESLNDYIRRAMPDPDAPAVGMMSRVSLGVLPTGVVNALTIPVPESDEYIIAFNDELFTFIYLMAKSAVCGLPVEEVTPGSVNFTVDKEIARSTMDRDRSIQQRFNTLALAYLIGGRASRTPPYRLPDQKAMLAAQFANQAELFTLCHEYAHVFNKHLSQPPGPPVPVTINGRVVKSIPHSWKQEMEADTTGFLMYQRAIQVMGLDFATSLVGPELLFQALIIVGEGQSLLKTGRIEDRLTDEHPPAHYRVRVVRQIASSLVDQERLSGILQFADTVSFILNLLWERARPEFERMYLVPSLLEGYRTMNQRQ